MQMHRGSLPFDCPSAPVAKPDSGLGLRLDRDRYIFLFVAVKFFHSVEEQAQPQPTRDQSDCLSWVGTRRIMSSEFPEVDKAYRVIFVRTTLG